MDAATAGPSRIPTITTEDEEMEAEVGHASSAAEGTGYPNGSGDHEGQVNGGSITPGGGVNGDSQVDAVPDPNAVPEGACETIYIQNLNEKVQVPVMKQTLQNLFKPYRPLLPIIAHKNLRMKGQAFVSFPDVETANRVRKEVNEFPLYGKAMIVNFARTKSDSIIKKAGGEEALEEHKKERLADKKRKRRDNPLRRKALAKLKADDVTADVAAAAPQKKARVQISDEYLPPNNILFVQNLPEGTTSDDLREVFELTIPAKKDIAFIEYGDEGAATLAKEALHNFKIDGETKMKVTYARR